MDKSMLQCMYPMLVMTALGAAPTIGFGIYDRINAKRQEQKAKIMQANAKPAEADKLAQFYNMQNSRRF